MACSCTRNPFGFNPFEMATRTPGALGHNDAACPDTPLWFLGDTPCSVGINDHADPQNSSKIKDGKPIIIEASLGCACNREITLNELCKVFTKQKKKVCELYLPHINSTFENYDITTCLRKAHFLAQIGHESGELLYTAEVLGKGKKESGVYDGYKGRGLIQITWGKNYKAYGDEVGHDFLGEHRDDLTQPEWATDSAGWYWTSGSGKDLNDLADNNDLLAITARVNGGFNGFDDRKKILQLGFKILKVSTCKTAGIGNQVFRSFKESEIYNNIAHAFAWGCWNDPNTGKNGVLKSPEEQKNGYLRFLELNKEMVQKNLKLKSRYGFSPEKMLSLATEGTK
ncbi:MAG: glycoside hydrolase family 19 protein [Desulfuromonadaceae bacterium]